MFGLRLLLKPFADFFDLFGVITPTFLAGSVPGENVLGRIANRFLLIIRHRRTVKSGPSPIHPLDSLVFGAIGMIWERN